MNVGGSVFGCPVELLSMLPKLRTCYPRKFWKFPIETFSCIIVHWRPAEDNFRVFAAALEPLLCPVSLPLLVNPHFVPCLCRCS